jgi:hypothetical protein
VAWRLFYIFSSSISALRNAVEMSDVRAQGKVLSGIAMDPDVPKRLSLYGISVAGVRLPANCASLRALSAAVAVVELMASNAAYNLLNVGDALPVITRAYQFYTHCQRLACANTPNNVSLAALESSVRAYVSPMAPWLAFSYGFLKAQADNNGNQLPTPVQAYSIKKLRDNAEVNLGVDHFNNITCSVETCEAIT